MTACDHRDRWYDQDAGGWRCPNCGLLESVAAINYTDGVEIDETDALWDGRRSVVLQDTETGEPLGTRRIVAAGRMLTISPERYSMAGMYHIHICQRCNHEWPSRQERPTICPKCKSPYWHTPRKPR